MRRDRPFEVSRHLVREFGGYSPARSGGRSDVWEPPMDVYETHREVVIKLALPGIRTRDVQVQFEGERITISGQRRSSSEAETTCYHRMEIRNGYFERSVLIHRPFDPERASASYEDGFLWVRIPKKPPGKGQGL